MISPSPSIVPSSEAMEHVLGASSPVDRKQRPCNLLIATIDSEIRNSLIEFLQTYVVNTIWARGMEEIKSSLIRDNVAACFCGFWLVDGTYRDIVRYVKRQRAEVPLIVVCPPTCSQEHQESLAALNIRGFDVIRYPYRLQDLERALHGALSSHSSQTQMAPSSRDSSHKRFASSGLR